jgi:hypothetical protein
MYIMAFVLVLALVAVLVAVIHVLRQGDPLEPAAPFRFEDTFEQVPEIRQARQRAMAVPGKYPALRTRNSR